MVTLMSDLKARIALPMLAAALPLVKTGWDCRRAEPTRPVRDRRRETAVPPMQAGGSFLMPHQEVRANCCAQVIKMSTRTWGTWAHQLPLNHPNC